MGMVALREREARAAIACFGALLATGAGQTCLAHAAAGDTPQTRSHTAAEEGPSAPAHTATGNKPPARAHAAQALKATDTAHLHYLSASGSLLFEEGKASGTLPGNMRVHFSVGASISGSFTIYAKGWSISGHGSATPHGVGVYESFAGSLTVTHGSGRYAHAHGQARLYGTFNRNSYALLVQTVGTLHY
jgi:hypothetical protein